VLGKQRLWVIGAKASHGAAAGEGPQQWPHHWGRQEVPVDEVRTELTERGRQHARAPKERADGGFSHVEEDPLRQPHGRLPHLVAGVQERVDQDGELRLPADETLVDVADPNLAPAEEAAEEAQDQAGPLAEEVELEE
jgi:hypothetical protein